MEPFVKSLYDRLDKDKQLNLFVIMQGAIDEMHNNGIIELVDAMGPNQLHDSDPEVRVTQKTLLAKSIGKGFISTSTQMPMNGMIIYKTPVQYDPRFMKSICICLQGGLEGLHMSGITKNIRVIYNVLVTSGGNDMSSFSKLISQLNSFYDDINVRLVIDGVVKSEDEVPVKEPIKKHAMTASEKEIMEAKKKAYLEKLFGKKKATRHVVSSGNPVYDQYYTAIVSDFSGKAKAAYDAVVEKAKKEVIMYESLYEECFGEKLDESKWNALSKEDQFEHVIKLGNFGVTQQFVLCADFVDYIPNCDALAIFIRAHTQPKEKRKQIVDAGDNARKTALKQALNSLKACDPFWECSVF